jgi:orotate phosphoribosyltransferase
LNAVKALREANAQVKGMLALFSYGFDTATTNFEEAQAQLHTLSNYQHLLEQAEKSKYITKDELETLQQWRKDPANWMQ